jgi:hypothetical protein
MCLICARQPRASVPRSITQSFVRFDSQYSIKGHSSSSESTARASLYRRTASVVREKCDAITPQDQTLACVRIRHLTAVEGEGGVGETESKKRMQLTILELEAQQKSTPDI